MVQTTAYNLSGRALSCSFKGWSVTIDFLRSMRAKKEDQMGGQRDILSSHLCNRCGGLFITKKENIHKDVDLKS